MSAPVKVFVSYAHEDERYRKQLGAHLSQLKNEGLISEWHDREVIPGREWANEIDQHIETAEIILLLVSPDFLASSYCVEIEMQRAMNRHNTGSALVIPVILRPADWANAAFAKLQVLPKDARPIRNCGNRDQAWLDVAKGIRRTIDEIADSRREKAGTVNDLVEPDWHQRLDRIEQTGTARYLVGDMLKYGQTNCLCFCWYGGPRDGVNVFHDRLEREFDEVATGRCWSVRPEWPGVIERIAFREMLQFTLDASDDLGTAMRKHFRGRHDRRHVCYINHTPVESSRQLSPQQLLDYLRWWDEEVLPQLEPQQCVVLGISFIVNDPIRFRYAVDSVAAIPAHPFSDRFVFKFLPVLAQLEHDDIRTFFKRIDMQRRVDQPTQERAIEKILQDTNGEYDLVVRELEVLINQGFDEFADLAKEVIPERDAEDLGY